MVAGLIASGAAAQGFNWGEADCREDTLDERSWKNFVQMQHRLPPDDPTIEGPDIQARHRVYEKCHEVLEYTRHVLNASGFKEYSYSKRDEYVFGAPQGENSAADIHIYFLARGPNLNVILEFDSRSLNPFQIQPIRKGIDEFKLTWTGDHFDEESRPLSDDETVWLLEAVLDAFKNPPDLSAGYPSQPPDIDHPIAVSMGSWTVMLHRQASNRKAYWNLISLANVKPPERRTLNDTQETLPE